MRWRWRSTTAPTDRLIGTCAFSQLDADNGSALFHITIGEKDAWGQGYGTEATGLMLDHAFGELGLHRIALYVFEFNERAIRAYRRCGFVVEGRSREAIWRDGRWWDELAMSVLEADWRRAAEDRAASDEERAALVAEADAGQATDGASGPGAEARRRPAGRSAGAGQRSRSGLVRRTIRRFTMSSTGPGADAARAEVRELIAAKGHSVDNARAVDGAARRRLR